MKHYLESHLDSNSEFSKNEAYFDCIAPPVKLGKWFSEEVIARVTDAQITSVTVEINRVLFQCQYDDIK